MYYDIIYIYTYTEYKSELVRNQVNYIINLCLTVFRFITLNTVFEFQAYFSIIKIIP